MAYRPKAHAITEPVQFQDTLVTCSPLSRASLYPSLNKHDICTGNITGVSLHQHTEHHTHTHTHEWLSFSACLILTVSCWSVQFTSYPSKAWLFEFFTSSWMTRSSTRCRKSLSPGSSAGRSERSVSWSVRFSGGSVCVLLLNTLLTCVSASAVWTGMVWHVFWERSS